MTRWPFFSRHTLVGLLLDTAYAPPGMRFRFFDTARLDLAALHESPYFCTHPQLAFGGDS